MTANDFEKAFGGATAPRTSFTERLGRDAAAPANDDSFGAAAKPAGVYKAYGFLPTNTVGETCDVQRWIDGTEIPEGIEFQYRFLMRIEYTGEEEIRLFLPDCIVVIEGKCLRELRGRLARRQVTHIVQHSPKVWPQKAAVGEPIVECIHVVRPSP